MASPLALEQWVIKVGGKSAQLIEMRRFASGAFALIRTASNPNGQFIKIPGEVTLTLQQGWMIGQGPISKLPKIKKPLVKRFPYWPKIKWYD